MYTSHGFGFGFFATALLGLSVLTCATLLLGGWRQRRHLLARQAGGAHMESVPLPFTLAQMPFASSVWDVETELRDVLRHMTVEATEHLVQFDLAVQPDLSVHADRAALRAVLCELVTNAVRRTPGGRVLLSALRLGGRVQIAVIDDGHGLEAAGQEAGLREMAQVVALQGGTIDVEACAGEGTTVLVRLADGTGIAHPYAEEPRRPAAERADSPRPARETVVEHSFDI